MPGDKGGWQWLCLDHVRAFNAKYNFFDGLSVDEIHDAQSPLAGWERDGTGRAFTFGDPHDLFGGSRPAPAPKRWPGLGDGHALEALGLTDAATVADVRRAYKRLVRRFHPDSNGGDRSHEAQLQRTVNAWQHLRASPGFQGQSRSGAPSGNSGR